MRRTARRLTALAAALTLALAPGAAWAEPTQGTEGTGDATGESPTAPAEEWDDTDAPVASVQAAARTLDDACLGEAPGFLRATPDGKTLFAITGEDTVCVVDTASLTVTHTIDLPGQVMGVASSITLSADGTRLFVMTAQGLAVIDTTTLETTTLDVPTTDFASTKDGRTLTALVQDGDAWTLTAYDTGTGETTAPVTLDTSGLTETPTALIATALSDDAGTLIATAQLSTNENICAIDTASGALTRLADTSVSYLARVAPDGTLAYFMSTGVHDILVVDVNTQDVTVISVDPAARITGITLSADGSTLALTASRGARVYNVANGQLIRNLAPNEPAQYLTPDGSLLLASRLTDDGTLTIDASPRDAAGTNGQGGVTVNSAAIPAGQWNGGQAGEDAQIRDAAVAADGTTLYLLMQGAAEGDGNPSESATAGGATGATASGATDATANGAAGEAATSGKIVAVDLTALADASKRESAEGGNAAQVVLIVVLAVVLAAVIAAMVVILVRRRRA